MQDQLPTDISYGTLQLMTITAYQAKCEEDNALKSWSDLSACNCPHRKYMYFITTWVAICASLKLAVVILQPDNKPATVTGSWESCAKHLTIR